jgi:type I restriction enzyme, S subunit
MAYTSMSATTDGPWHGAVPPGWTLKQLKWAVTFQRGHDLPTEDRNTGPVPVFAGGGITGWHDVLQARGPGIVTGRYGTIGEFHLVKQDYWPLNTSLYSIDLHGNHAAFVRYMLEPLAPLFHLNAAKSAVPGIDRSDIHTIPVAVPPLPAQRAIADYLDRETARLDALVAAKERVLGLLAEKRRALITRAVTRGLDPRVPLRDSGIPWLGELPAHWETERTRWLFKERDQRSATGEEELLTVSHLTGVTPRSEKDVNMFEAETTEGYKVCLSGDLVINTLWAWMGAMGVSPVDGIASPAYNVYEPGALLEPSYVDALVRLPVFAQEVTRYSKGVWSSRLRLYPEGFFEVFLPVPSRSEQRAIVAHIANETNKLDKLRVATERSTVLLKERRAALIAAAVSGQIDTPDAQ